MTLVKGEKRLQPGRESERKLSGSLIKKGTISPEPALYFRSLAAESPLPESSPPPPLPKTVQVFHDRGTDGESPLSPAILDMGKAREEADKIIAEAREQADRILEEAKIKTKKLIEQSKLYCETAQANAEREGFAKGREQGEKAGREEARGAIAQVGGIISQLQAERDDLAKRAEQKLAELSVKIAERVIAGEVSANPNVVVNMVKANLERVKEQEKVVVHVHPEDLETAKAQQDLFARLVPGIRHLEVQSDPRVERGGCVLETDLGIVDAKISTQLEAIRQLFSGLDKEEKSE